LFPKALAGEIAMRFEALKVGEPAWRTGLTVRTRVARTIGSTAAVVSRRVRDGLLAQDLRLDPVASEPASGSRSLGAKTGTTGHSGYVAKQLLP
jgi:hypothetical protein